MEAASPSGRGFFLPGVRSARRRWKRPRLYERGRFFVGFTEESMFHHDAEIRAMEAERARDRARPPRSAPVGSRRRLRARLARLLIVLGERLVAAGRRLADERPVARELA